MPGSFLSLLLVLVLTGALTCGAAVVLTAVSLLRPPRMSDGKALYLLGRLTPGDLGMPFEDVSFTVRDDRTARPLRLAAWWIPAAPASDDADGRCVVLLHGYADAKVGAIAWAPVWHELGFHILALDLRAHGQSEGRYTTAGYFERHDVRQVIDQICAERPGETRQVVLFGASSGAAVAVASACMRQEGAGAGDEVGGASVAAVVLESPVADFRRAATTHMGMMGLPTGALASAAVTVAEWISGARFDEVRPVDGIAALACPVMVILPADDPYVSPGDAEAIAAAVHARAPGSGPGAYWCPPGAGHLTAIVTDGAEYRRRLTEFVEAALPRPAGATRRGCS